MKREVLGWHANTGRRKGIKTLIVDCFKKGRVHFYLKGTEEKTDWKVDMENQKKQLSFKFNVTVYSAMWGPLPFFSATFHQMSIAT